MEEIISSFTPGKVTYFRDPKVLDVSFVFYLTIFSPTVVLISCLEFTIFDVVEPGFDFNCKIYIASKFTILTTFKCKISGIKYIYHCVTVLFMFFIFCISRCCDILKSF